MATKAACAPKKTIQHTTQPQPSDAGHLPCAAVPSDGVLEPLLVHQLGQESKVGGAKKTACQTRAKNDRVDARQQQPRRHLLSIEYQQQQGRRAHQQHCHTAHEDVATVVLVGQVACPQADADGWNGFGQADKAQFEWVAREVVHEIAHRDRHDLDGQGHHQAHGEEAAVVGDAQRGVGIGLRRSGVGREIERCGQSGADLSGKSTAPQRSRCFFVGAAANGHCGAGRIRASGIFGFS